MENRSKRNLEMLKIMALPIGLALLVGVLSWMSARSDIKPANAGRPQPQAQAPEANTTKALAPQGVEAQPPQTLFVSTQQATQELNRKLQEEIAKLEDMTNGITAALSDRTEREAELTAQLAQMKQALEQAESKTRERDTRIAELEGKLTNSESARTKMAAELEKTKAQIAPLTAQLETAQAALMDEQAVKAELLTKLSQSQADHEQTLRVSNNWQQLHASSQERLASLAQAADSRGARISDLEKTAAHLQTQLDEKVAELGKPNPELEKAKSQARSLGDQLEAARAALVDAEAVKGQLLQRISSLQASAGRLTPQHAAQFLAMEEEIEGWKRLQRDSQQRLMDMCDGISTREQTLEQLEEQVTELRTRIAEESRVKSELLRRLAEIQTRG